MSNLLKNKYYLSALAGIIYLLGAQTAFAQCAPDHYQLIVPIGMLPNCVNLADYLKGILETTIGIAGILAVIMIVWCGIKLMTTGSAGGKSEAKECITNAILGVLLAIGSWLLLNTINPLLLKNTTTLATIPVPTTPAPPTGPTIDPMPTVPSWYYRYKDAKGNIRNSPKYDGPDTCLARQKNEEANGSAIQNGPNGTPGCFEIRGVPQPAGEIATRNAICGNDSCVNSSNSNVFINNNSCNPPNRDSVHDKVKPGCTNVNGLPASTISLIKGLAASCNCKVFITGGTEVGHKTHAQGQPIFDLRWSNDTHPLSQIIKASGNTRRQSFANNWEWLYSGHWFTEERVTDTNGKVTIHWHVCAIGAANDAGVPYSFCK